MKRKLTKATLSELELHAEIVKMFEQKMIIGGGSGTTYSMEEYMGMIASGSWAGGYVEGLGYVGANDCVNWDSNGHAYVGSTMDSSGNYGSNYGNGSGYGSDYGYGSGYGSDYGYGSNYGYGSGSGYDSSFSSSSNMFQGPNSENMSKPDQTRIMTWQELTEFSYPVGYLDGPIWELLKNIPGAGPWFSIIENKINNQLNALKLQISQNVDATRSVKLKTSCERRMDNVYHFMQINYIDKNTHQERYTELSSVQIL